MMTKIRLIVLSFLAVVGFVLVPAPVANAEIFDAATKDACSGASLSNGSSGNCSKDSEKRLTDVISTAINLFSIIIGIVAVIMIMVAGFRYITSAGDSNGITSAKHTLIYAIVGLIVAAMAQIIVRFVLSKV